MSMDSTQLCRHLRTYLPPASAFGAARSWAVPLWDHALALYAQPEVMTACLYLQDDAGVDVCELLWVCWLQVHGLTLDDDVDSALDDVRAWQTEMTLPLRRQRRALKKRALTNPGLAELRETIQRAELLAERETLVRLQTLAERGQGIRPLGAEDPPLEKRLASRLGLQKKPHLSALKTLETRLDPPTQPR
ncbi:TIGR02444 family protein [Litchfieldella rifensis]|uniref:TIGR02444 family protein n=1 Tax=Litchfieldella rifensis TaxID=762643 RepID=A0ABV7LVN4_9GAMM